jgi:antitoxin HigA-1
MAINIHSTFSLHPGPWLREEIVVPTGLTITAVAEHLGVSRQAISMLFNGRNGLTAEMAIRFEKAFGINADSMLAMQTRYELDGAREHEKEILVKPIDLAA